MNRFFTGDTHFFHETIIRLQPRPFSSLEEMHEIMVERWNERVKPGDIVYHHGDFALSKAADKEAIKKLFMRLNGQKFLIHGNHDLKNSIVLKLPWVWQGDLRTFNIDGQLVVGCHFAMQVWDQSNKRAWHTYGHSHGNLANDPHSLKMDVGVDANNFQPVSLEEVAKVMSTKDYMPLDHHKEDPDAG